jgi:protein-S-isoprenylcysteine O-methyltransferase Ste14
LGGRDRWFKASLVYTMSFRTAKATQKFPVKKKNKTNGAREMAQWLKALAFLLEVLSSVPETTWWLTSIYDVICCLLLVCRYTCRQSIFKKKSINK